MPDLAALIKQFGLRVSLIIFLLYYVLIHQDGQIKALLFEAQVTNVRLMAICVEQAGGDVGKSMGCMATSTAPQVASAK